MNDIVRQLRLPLRVSGTQKARADISKLHTKAADEIELLRMERDILKEREASLEHRIRNANTVARVYRDQRDVLKEKQND